MKTFNEIRNVITPVLEKYHVKSAYIFGSYARGEAKETSDLECLWCFIMIILLYLKLADS